MAVTARGGVVVQRIDCDEFGSVLQNSKSLEKISMICNEKIIVIDEPVPFYSYEDEEHFFSWLKSIPAIKEFVGTPQGLQLTITDPIDDESLYELIGLMTRYRLKRKCLKVFCNPSNQDWFKKSKKYWYKAVFGDQLT